MDLDLDCSYKHPLPCPLVTPPGQRTNPVRTKLYTFSEHTPRQMFNAGGEVTQLSSMDSLEFTKFKWPPTCPTSNNRSLVHSFSTPQSLFSTFSRLLETSAIPLPFSLACHSTGKKKIKSAERSSSISHSQTFKLMCLPC